jgi:hypothetical protein
MQYLHSMTILLLLFVLVLIPAAIGYCLYIEILSGDVHPSAFAIWRHLSHTGLAPGDFLIYTKSKVSHRPGPRARNVHPSEKGDDYYYEVDKYWTVADVLEDGRLVAKTRTGKQVFLTPEDEKLRKARLIERLLFRRRFPAL